MSLSSCQFFFFFNQIGFGNYREKAILDKLPLCIDVVCVGLSFVIRISRGYL